MIKKKNLYVLLWKIKDLNGKNKELLFTGQEWRRHQRADGHPDNVGTPKDFKSSTVHPYNIYIYI